VFTIAETRTWEDPRSPYQADFGPRFTTRSNPSHWLWRAQRFEPKYDQSTGTRQAHFKCCRDPWFMPPPPSPPGGAADCQFTGYLTDCRPNQEILEGAVAGCFRAGLVHKSTTFKNDCPGGSRDATSICCRPGVVGPPVDHCAR